MENLQKAANGGHVAAHYHLAIVYRTGVDKSVPADKKAFLRHLQLAVEGDDPDALFCLADCYMQGLDGYPHDQSKAVPYLLKATANEHADAAVTLGALYYSGLAGLKQDKRKAFELYNTAAELGSVDAWRNLAGMYYTGDGVPKNEEVAKQIMKVVFNKDDMDTKPAAP
jgi:TPR repeat protein